MLAVLKHRPLISLLLATAVAAGCSSDSDHDSPPDDGGGGDSYALPPPPVGTGAEATAGIAAGVVAYVDDGATNVRTDPCHVTVDTNAGLRVLRRFLDVWRPSTMMVDAGVTLASSGACPAVTPATWSGIPGDATDGVVLNAAVHAANIGYVEAATHARTAAQELAAYLDDRRQKGYSVTDGLGPLTPVWLLGSQQATTIFAIAADANRVLYSDTGNNIGFGSATNPDLGLAVDFIAAMSGDGSTEPAKRFYKYARPWRWSTNVAVAPSLVPAESATPATDGGFLSGHAAEGWRDALAMAYLVPQRYQELIARALELGENRIIAGMHSPLDVIGGRIQATAVVAYNLSKPANAALARPAFDQAQSWLRMRTGVADAVALEAFAHAAPLATDRFAAHDENRATVRARLTYDFTPIASTTAPAVVPKGAEVLLETRLPYLTAAQRRVVLATTALASGYPVLDDEEGWGRLNLFAAADGYGAFGGDVTVAMDAAQGGFSAIDAWRNDIAGPGRLTKRGTGRLRLTGANGYTGGTVVEDGALVAASTSALGRGDVYVSGGTLVSGAPGALVLGGKLTVRSAATVELAMAAAGQGTLLVTGAVGLDGGTLHVTFPGGYTPVVGDTLWIVVAGELHGRFSTIAVDGFRQVTPAYESDGLRLVLVAR